MSKRVYISTNNIDWTEINAENSLLGSDQEWVNNEQELLDTSMEDYNLISCLVVDLYYCVKHPSEYLERFTPTAYTRRAWIPQTLGDCIWILYKFNSEEDKLKWENSLEGIVKTWLNRKIIPYALEFGWEIRDHNGFII